ncbi:hypothetical protein BGZ61DRAFT_490199 [Ilyonectria robusta]|uniref:uncharacterized protein n=1 Tax=Ilyonectria robusta TaxID=1079257 RepID=UPI001E8DD166|nr:uncharacterized protein BGZ61DRAFT_490199 [Ilyonectria robusta]KAH8736578.1 hypothetical protein BGZ61DRAFT_490199 [Ilyonectria robusta]
MPSLGGFSDNPLQTRADVMQAVVALLKPLTQYFSPAHARIRIPRAVGTKFDETAAQLEGFARPLWAIGALLMGGEPAWDLIDQWVEGFEAGVDPEHPEYWGAIKDMDQRMVETEMISFALLATPKHLLWDRFSPKTQSNMIHWLLGLHGKAMPPANWLWFRVFANLALRRVCGVDTPEVRESMRVDLEVLDSMYICDGWSGDGVWRSSEIDEEEYRVHLETGRANTIQASRSVDYYSGSFAIQFSQLLYVRFAYDLDLKRTEKYRQQARDFGQGFSRFFDTDGAAIPFGRSLTYRFACGGFFAALALANVWWARHSEDIFDPDGTLNLGWIYPNMYLTEDYNSPQSVYWAMKSLIVVALGENDAFWTEPERPGSRGGVAIIQAPRQILCNHPDGNHHFLLSTSQFVAVPFKGVTSKYSKFAYSSSFAFSVPTGHVTLGQLAPDSTLALSRDGTDTWAVKYRSGEAKFSQSLIRGSVSEQVITASVSWYPWPDRSVIVNTTLVPPTNRWPDWHVRIHRLRALRKIGRVFTAEGGFAVNGRRRSDALSLPVLRMTVPEKDVEVGLTEGVILNPSSVLIMSSSGMSGVSTELLLPSIGTTSVTSFKPEPNTNLMACRTLIPLIEQNILGLEEGEEVILVTKVFAVSKEANGGWKKAGKSVQERWLDQPQLYGLTSLSHGDFIHLIF